MAKRADCDLSMVGSTGQSHPEGTGVKFRLSGGRSLREEGCGDDQTERRTKSSFLQVHLGSLYCIHCSFYSPENQTGCQHTRKQTSKLSSQTRSQLSISPPVHRGALVPEYQENLSYQSH